MGQGRGWVVIAQLAAVACVFNSSLSWALQAGGSATNTAAKTPASTTTTSSTKTSTSADDQDQDMVVVCTSSSSLQSLQTIHPFMSPANALLELAEFCQQQGIQQWDVYGDFDESTSSSFLRRFETELALDFGKEEALVMPSGTMAQQIALLIHAAANNNKNNNNNNNNNERFFACHPTSHLLLHEHDAYRELSAMKALLVQHHTNEHDQVGKQRLSMPPLLFVDVKRTVDQHMLHSNKNSNSNNMPSTLLLEMPHREIGGQLTPWNDVIQMREYCRQHNMAFHCDGARFLEAAAGYDNMTLAQLAAPFDSIYLSFYKGLGGMAGSVLLGTKPFIAEARLWLSRFGGNLYTILPYAVSGWMGYQRYWKMNNGNDEKYQQSSFLSFVEKKKKLQTLVSALQIDPAVVQIVSFDPNPPQTNMVHAYFLNATAADCLAASEKAFQITEAEGGSGVRVLHRVRDLVEADSNDINNNNTTQQNPAYARGYRSKMEWTMGEANGRVSNDVILKSWHRFAKVLQDRISSQNHSCGNDETDSNNDKV